MSGGPERPLRVLGLYWLDSFWSMGRGIGASSFFLSPQSFARFGHEVHISAPRGRGQPACEIDEGVRIHRYRCAIGFESDPRKPLPIRVTSRLVRYLAFLVIGTWQGWRLGRRVRPDVVIGYHYHGAVPARWIGRLLGVPNVTRLFGTQLNRILGHPLKMMGAFMQILALRTPAAAIIMHDDGSQGDVVARRLGVPPGRLRFWRDGYDPELYAGGERFPEERRALGIPDGRTILFCVGRLGEDKRMDRLIEILPDVLREEPAVTLLLVGDGPDRAAIESAVREHGLEDRVRLTGAVPRDRVRRCVNLGDIFIGVSDRTNANLPPIEAMTCAKPVVALDTGGTRDLIEDGVTGILIDPARWREELPRALVALVRDPERQARLGTAAREKIVRELPTLEQRQRMEVDLVLEVVRAAR
jgi:glycosyltransferase involved in cell wall biosynthesis